MIWQADLIDCWSRHHSFSSLLIESFARRTANSGILPPAADLFAYSVYGQESGQKPFDQARGPLKSEASYPGNLHRVPLVRDVLDGLYEQALAMPRARAPAHAREKSLRKFRREGTLSEQIRNASKRLKMVAPHKSFHNGVSAFSQAQMVASLTLCPELG
jgi:hypothetical protein